MRPTITRTKTVLINGVQYTVSVYTEVDRPKALTAIPKKSSYK